MKFARLLQRFNEIKNKVLSSPCLYIVRLWKQTGFIITIFT